jgi:autotransporter-associated beta strand protein
VKNVVYCLNRRAGLPGGLAAVLFLAIMLKASSVLGAYYYISTTGTDTNSGSINAPLATISGAQAVASPGDTVLIESGTYEVPDVLVALEQGVYEVVNLINKNGITYEAMPGTRPVFDFSGINPTGYRVAAFWVTASNVTFQGFDVTGVQENITTSNNQSLAFAVWGCSNCTWEQVNAYSNEGVGFYLEEDSPNNLFYQCDSYNNYGINSYSYGNADGFGCHPAAGGTGNVFRQCRSWNNSDDGYDCINAHESVTFDHCWSYLNGNNGGNGNGFKVGGWASTPQNQIANPLPVHTVVYCLSAGNTGNGGYYANHQPGQAANWWHNTGFDNVVDFNMLERTPPVYSSTVAETDSNDIPGINEVMHYNMAYTASYSDLENYNETGAIVSGNSWTENITLTNSDFESTVVTQMTQPRQANGALPNITFMVPVNGTPAAGLGCFAPPSALTWTGTTSNAWDIATGNWLNTTGSADVYCDGVPVTFSDAATTGTVSIASGVNPGSVTFTNSSLDYTVNSTSLGISGSTGVTMTGTAQVTVTGSNTYTGNTTLGGGIYALGADSSTSSSTVESPGLTGGTCASLGAAASAVLASGGAELRFGGRGGGTAYTYVIPNPVTLDGASIVSVDGLQELTGGLTIGSAGANLFTAYSGKNLWIHSTWSGSGNVTIDDWQASGSDTTGGLLLVDGPSNPYDGVITIDAPSAGYLGGILEIGNTTALLNATIIDNNTGTAGLLFTVTTPQIGALSGPGNITIPSGGSLTAGGNGASTTYSGNLSGAGGFTKAGAGTMILSGSNFYTGATTVTGGILEITGAIINSASLSVSSGAVLYLDGTPNVSGTINNNGIVKLSGATSLTGTFTNNGVLDLINGPQSLPSHFINNGTVLTQSSVQVRQLATSGSSGFSLTIQGYALHTYQLQRATSLAPPITWTNIGAPQTGSGLPITFSDPSLTASNGFYRVQVSP